MNQPHEQHPTDLVHTERNTLKGRALGEIVLNRPDKRNALTPDMLQAIHHATTTLIADESIQAIVIRGEGETFCSGFDLTLCQQHPGTLETLLTLLSQTITTLRAAPKPVVIGVQGAALAGAAALLAAADLVIADTNARFGYPVVRLGISPAVSAPSLIDAIGTGPARARLLNPEIIDAHRAHQLGWVHTLVPAPEDVQPRAQTEAARLADKPPHAYATTKAWLRQVADPSHADSATTSLNTSLDLAESSEQRKLLAKALDRS